MHSHEGIHLGMRENASYILVIIHKKRYELSISAFDVWLGWWEGQVHKVSLI